jgi:CBS domain-containing protein
VRLQNSKHGFSQRKEMAMQLVSEIMTRNVQAVSPRESLRRAAQMMDELNVGALPVCEGERLIGMVTDRDITVRATSAGITPDDAAVNEVMSTDVRWCFEDQPLDEVMRQMADTQIRRVPVVSHDEIRRLVGIVSLGDIATRSHESQERGLRRVVEKVSFPSEPERGSQGGAVDAGGIGASDTGTATGLAGSDFLDERMNSDTGTYSGADPSDVVEVTPDELLNRHAPGSTTLGAGRNTARQEGVTVRHIRGDADGPTGVAGSWGASGGAAGGDGSPGTGIDEKP